MSTDERNEKEAAEALDPDRITPEKVLSDSDARQLIDMADDYLAAIGYTDHGIAHITRVSNGAARIVRELGLGERNAELTAIAGLLHDVGNLVHRDGHPQSSAIMAFSLLREMGMNIAEAATVAGAIGNHDESNGDPVSVPSAALIIADKADVTRSRVRSERSIHFDIHDRVNYAVTDAEVTVDRAAREITLRLEVDTSISQVMEYFEIFLGRMKISRRAAQYLNCDLKLVINGTVLS